MNKEVIQPLLGHFDAQEAALLALKSLLRDIGMCSVNSNSRSLMYRIQAATDLMQRLDHDCRLLVEQLADELKCPSSQISIRYLISILKDSDPESAEALRSCRSRLLSLRWQVGRVAASSGWIISEQRRIRHAIFQQASGLTDSDRYDASGRTALSPDSLRIGTRS